MDVWSLLERTAARSPQAPAVSDGTRRFTYEELHRRASSLARSLAARKVARGDRVVLLAWNGAEFIEATFAVAALGAILVPVNARLSAVEITEIVRLAGARVQIGEGGPEHEAEIERHAGSIAPAPVGPDDVANLYFTSGTTGRPKGVPLTHRNVCAHARAACAELSLASRDVWGHIAPMFHLADAWANLAITEVGGLHACLPRFEAGAALDLLVRERVTITNLVPTMLSRMVAHPGAGERDYGSLRLVLSGGAPIAPTLVAAAMRTFRCEYAQTYGMTETSPYLAISLLSESMRLLPAAEQLAIRCKTGRAFHSVELRLLGDDGLEVPRDNRTVGEILARGETVTPGYWNDPEATRAAFADGWLRTGDLAVIDAQGYLTIVDRRKDVIKSGGETVYTTEVENALHAHPCVLEAAVLGIPDEDLGERIVAAVVLRPGASVGADELRESCRRTLAGVKVPREVRFLRELPRTGSGKISKRALRELDSFEGS
ncbi:MAG: class I adenylate-forming enzyme family protein [Planctomycetota bacterium]